jgi:putative hydrolase of the HAD superfamily
MFGYPCGKYRKHVTLTKGLSPQTSTCCFKGMLFVEFIDDEKTNRDIPFVRTLAVIFDLDDTLVAFDLVTESTWRQVCDEYAAANPAHPAAAVYDAVTSESHWYWSDEERHRVGRNDIFAARRGIVKSAFEKHGLPLHDAVKVADRYSTLRLENMYVLPGAKETLSLLSDGQIPLGLITNGDSETQRSKIDRFGLGGYFKEILIEGEVGFGKPDRRIFELAVSRFGVTPEQMLMVGDNLKWDVAGPQSVGMRGIWFDVKKRGLQKNSTVVPDAVITSIAELPEHLK